MKPNRPLQVQRQRQTQLQRQRRPPKRKKQAAATNSTATSTAGSWCGRHRGKLGRSKQCPYRVLVGTTCCAPTNAEQIFGVLRKPHRQDCLCHEKQAQREA